MNLVSKHVVLKYHNYQICQKAFVGKKGYLIIIFKNNCQMFMIWRHKNYLFSIKGKYYSIISHMW